MTAQELAQSYDGKIVVKRAKATGDDFIVLFLVIAVAGAIFDTKSVWTVVEICLAICAVYYVGMEAVFGRTVGKMFRGLSVVDSEGKKPSFGAVFLRTLSRLLEVNPILFGAAPAGLIANFSESHQRLGDVLAGTFVVYTKDLPRITHSPITGAA